MNSKKLVKSQHYKYFFTVVIWRIFRVEKHSVLYWKNASFGGEATATGHYSASSCGPIKGGVARICCLDFTRVRMMVAREKFLAHRYYGSPWKGQMVWGLSIDNSTWGGPYVWVWLPSITCLLDWNIPSINTNWKKVI